MTLTGSAPLHIDELYIILDSVPQKICTGTTAFPVPAAFIAPQNSAADALILHSTQLPYLAMPLYTILTLTVSNLTHSPSLWSSFYDSLSFSFDSLHL